MVTLDGNSNPVKVVKFLHPLKTLLKSVTLGILNVLIVVNWLHPMNKPFIEPDTFTVILDIDVNGQKYKSMPIFHPSYLLRNHSMEAGKPRVLMLEDLKKIRDIII